MTRPRKIDRLRELGVRACHCALSISSADFQMFQQLTRPFSAEVSLGIGGEILAWLGQCEGFDELVVVEKVIRFFRTPSGSNVFNRGAAENQGAVLFLETFEGALINEY